MDKIRQICLKRGIIFPESEIYGGMAGFYNYGPIGVLLKNNFLAAWRRFFIEENIFEVETSLLQPKKVFEASGHLQSFADPIVQCKKCHSIFRADNLVEEELGIRAEGKSLEELNQIIVEKNLKCPKCKAELSKPKFFNLMFKSLVGPEQKEDAYLRPETAQGIFVSFKRIVSAISPKLPFGIAQIGKSFRNEISPRQFIIRLREFTQAEIEYFIDPKKKRVPNFGKWKRVKLRILTREMQLAGKEELLEIKAGDAVKEGLLPHAAMAYFMAKEVVFYQKLGIPFEALRFRHMLPEETPHYSKGNFDLEIKFDFGWKEVVGNAYRSSYDLARHAKLSNEKFFVEQNGKKVLPHVVEPSFGVERSIYAILLHNFREDDRGWSFFSFPAFLAPYQLAVFPLIRDEKMVKLAKRIYSKLSKEYRCYFEEKQSIGKRYAKADEIGTRFCITVDEQSLRDKTITVRDRDSRKQTRVEIKKLRSYLKKNLETI